MATANNRRSSACCAKRMTRSSLAVPFAAVALMRAVLEAALVNHYGASGRDLEAKIASVPDDKIRWRRKQELHQLRRFVNGILHTQERTPDDNEKSKPLLSEEEMVAYLGHLRSLIEDAPLQRSRIPDGRLES
jgi:hypothetical protein